MTNGSLTPDAPELKERVRSFWDEAACGEVYAQGESAAERFTAHASARYALEPIIPRFARFEEGRGKDVLEIGVGMGADHAEWARSRPRRLVGVDLTPRAVALTSERLRVLGHEPDVREADAESLPFADGEFDLVYSWGVLHHTPDTPRALAEVHRVLRPGGRARIMMYHDRSMVGYMLWVRYALLTGRLGTSLEEICARYLESPGTKAYSVDEGRALVARFSSAQVWSELCFGDLLEGQVGQRHQGRLLAVARKLWPRALIRRLLPGHGLYLLIDAVK